MNNQLDELYVRGSKNSKKVVPTMKQTEENPTNIQIECMMGQHYCHSRTYLRIIDVYDMFEGIITVRGYCCYNCANSFKPKSMIAFICSHDRRYYPKWSSGTLHTDRTYGKVEVVDPTKIRVDEIQKHRDRTKKYIKRMRESGILAKHRPKKIRVGQSVTAPRTDSAWWDMLDKVCKE